jgi:hypothetical protein
MAFDPRSHWRRLILATCATLAVPFLLPSVFDPPIVQENRVLAKAPGAPSSWKALAALPEEVEAYVADNFPARRHLIAWLNVLRLKLGISGSDRVIVGPDGWLFYDNGSHFGAARGEPMLSEPQTEAWLAGLAGRAESLAARGAALVVVVAPTKEMVHPEEAPAWFKGPNPNRPAAKLAKLAAASGAGDVIYPYDALRRQARWGLKTYSPHDTHWTGLGAYVAYAEIMSRLHARGLADPPRPLSDFEEVRIGSPTKPRDLARMLGVADFIHPDYPEFEDPETEASSRIVWLTNEEVWTKPHVIETQASGKPVLLMIRDSFSNALLPYLRSHFSRIVLVHHEQGAWREDMIARFKPDIVMVEVIEPGVAGIMDEVHPPSPAARARIKAAVAAQRLQVAAGPETGRGQVVDGGAGADRLIGGQVSDVLSGRQGDDLVDGGGGEDTIRGGQGEDQLLGGDGADWLSGDRGDDTLSGGAGADIFHFGAGGGEDRVLDFSADQGDRLELAAGAAFTVQPDGTDTVVVVGAGKVRLVGVHPSALGPGRITTANR